MFDYLNITVQQVDTDWDRKTKFGKSENIYTNYPVRICKQEDFGDPNDALNIKNFKSWDGFIILCPDLPKGKHLVFKNDPSMIKSKYANIRVQKCVK